MNVLPKHDTNTLTPDISRNVISRKTVFVERTTPEIAVVLPFYNPGANWLNTFIAHSGTLEKHLAGNVKLKYIIVNDGSHDNELDKKVLSLCNEMENISYVTYKNNAGKGYALREGVKAANSTYTVITDIDFPYAIRNIEEIISLLLQGYDVVTGKRDNVYFNKLPFERKIISKTFILMNRLFFKLPVYDTQAGIKGFNEKGKAAFLNTKINRFLADTEFILRAHTERLTFKVIPIHLRPGVVFSNFGSSTIITELKNFFVLIQLNAKKKNAS
ncbi:MAG: glycosyltransferase [Agriterribacter sp.]